MASIRDELQSDQLSDLLGKGHLAITIDQGPGKDRYQGIVALEGNKLAMVIDAYFENVTATNAVMARCRWRACSRLPVASITSRRV